MSSASSRCPLLLVPLLLAFAGEARAEGAHAVLVTSEREADLFATRLAAELRAAGYRVVAPSEEPAPNVVVARVAASPREVLLFATPEQPPFHRELVEEGAESLAAVRAAEALRAFLLRPAPPVEPARPLPPQEVAAPARFALALGPGVAWSPGGIGPTGELGLEAAWQGLAPVGLRLGLHLPLVGSGALRGPEGSAQARVTRVALGADWRFASAGSVRPAAGAGIAVAVLSVAGAAHAGYADAEDTVFAAVPFARAGMGWSLSSRVELRSELLAGIAAPRLAVDFAGRRVATWGAPLLAGTLGVELTIP